MEEEPVEELVTLAEMIVEAVAAVMMSLEGTG